MRTDHRTSVVQVRRKHRAAATALAVLLLAGAAWFFASRTMFSAAPHNPEQAALRAPDAPATSGPSSRAASSPKKVPSPAQAPTSVNVLHYDGYTGALVLDKDAIETLLPGQVVHFAFGGTEVINRVQLRDDRGNGELYIEMSQFDPETGRDQANYSAFHVYQAHDKPALIHYFMNAEGIMIELFTTPGTPTPFVNQYQQAGQTPSHEPHPPET